MPSRPSPSIPVRVFIQCVKAIGDGAMIQRVSSSDKEFHFQNWFHDRLRAVVEHIETGGRNSYPDFRMVAHTDGFEVKGLAYPGREASFDSNSQLPTGQHNGRTIFYVFGRYPKEPDGDSYPVLDLVICHGDFLNADREPHRRNKSVKNFGSYGDILIRARRMYVAPTPFHLAEGLAHHQTLILPSDMSAPGLVKVGDLCRRECEQLVIGYTYDRPTDDLSPKLIANPNAGKEHHFTAWRVKSGPKNQVSMKSLEGGKVEVEDDESDDDSP
ncbi:MAG: hypothetical protein JSS27_15600 [Planctomycetes bacterium]|nr:hypothetical protein [Planctomycetota bacterium]